MEFCSWNEGFRRESWIRSLDRFCCGPVSECKRREAEVSQVSKARPGAPGTDRISGPSSREPGVVVSHVSKSRHGAPAWFPDPQVRGTGDTPSTEIRATRRKTRGRGLPGLKSETWGTPHPASSPPAQPPNPGATSPAPRDFQLLPVPFGTNWAVTLGGLSR